MKAERPKKLRCQDEEESWNIIEPDKTIVAKKSVQGGFEQEWYKKTKLMSQLKYITRTKKKTFFS